MRQRWFAAKDAKVTSIALKQFASLDGRSTKYPFTLCEVLLGDGEKQHYFLPLSTAWGSDNVNPGSAVLPFTLAKVRRGSRIAALFDAARDQDFVLDLVIAMSQSRDEQSGRVRFATHPSLEPFDAETSLRPIGGEQSNVSLIVGERMVLKLYRRIRPGLQPELEMARFLTNVADFKSTPGLLGAVEYVDEGSQEPSALAAAFAFVENQGDAWNVIVDALDRTLEEISLLPEDGVDQWCDDIDRLYAFPLDLASKLGQRTAEMHRALATETNDPAFKAEPLQRRHIREWCDAIKVDAERAFGAFEGTAYRKTKRGEIVDFTPFSCLSTFQGFQTPWKVLPLCESSNAFEGGFVKQLLRSQTSNFPAPTLSISLLKNQKMLDIHKLPVLRQLEAICGQLFLDLNNGHFMMGADAYFRILSPILDQQEFSSRFKGSLDRSEHLHRIFQFMVDIDHDC
jgi:hypothetical protein